MAKMKDLKDSFGSSRKKAELSPEDIDRIAEGVETSKIKVSQPEEVMIKTSLDFPASLYEEMKINLVRKRQSMKDYLVALVRQDLQKNK